MDVLAFARGGDQYFLGAGFNMPLSFLRIREKACRFHDIFDAQLLPRQRGRPFLDSQALDLMAIDDEGIIFRDARAGLFAADGAAELALG
jgi:hypothetical protein